MGVETMRFCASVCEEYDFAVTAIAPFALLMF